MLDILKTTLWKEILKTICIVIQTTLEFVHGPQGRNGWFNGLELASRCHQMETFSALLALCEGKPLVIGGSSSQRPVTLSFDVFFDLHLNTRLSKQWRRQWFEIPLRSLSGHCHGTGVRCSLWCPCSLETFYVTRSVNESISTQYSTVPLLRGQFSQKYSQKTSHSSPVRAKCFVDPASDWFSAWVPLSFMQYLTISDRVITALGCTFFTVVITTCRGLIYNMYRNPWYLYRVCITFLHTPSTKKRMTKLQ